MKKKISDRKTIQKLEKRLSKMIKKEYNNPDGFYCEITEVALTSDGEESCYTMDVHYGFKSADGEEIHRNIDDLIVAGPDGKIEIPFVAGRISQYIIDQDW